MIKKLNLFVVLILSFFFVRAQSLKLSGSFSGIENEKVEHLTQDIGNGFPFIANENNYEYLLHITKQNCGEGYELASIYMPINGNYNVQIAKITISETNTISLGNSTESKQISFPLGKSDLYIVITTDGLKNKEAITSLSISSISFEHAKKNSKVSIKTILPISRFWQFTKDMQLLLHTQGRQGKNFVMGDVLIKPVAPRIIEEEQIPQKYIYLLQNGSLGIFVDGVGRNISLEIYNINGIKVWGQQYNFSTSGLQTISLSHLKRGMYIVKMLTGSEVYSEKIVL